MVSKVRKQKWCLNSSRHKFRAQGLIFEDGVKKLEINKASVEIILVTTSHNFTTRITAKDFFFLNTPDLSHTPHKELDSEIMAPPNNPTKFWGAINSKFFCQICSPRNPTPNPLWGNHMLDHSTNPQVDSNWHLTVRVTIVTKISWKQFYDFNDNNNNKNNKNRGLSCLLLKIGIITI